MHAHVEAEESLADLNSIGAMSKRPCSSTCGDSAPAKKPAGGHKSRWDPSFSVLFPLALPVEDRDEPGNVIVGVLRKTCRAVSTDDYNVHVIVLVHGLRSRTAVSERTYLSVNGES